jgi:hypothetical protein
MAREHFGPEGWQVLSRSINTWLAAEVLERSEMADGTSVLNVRYTLPDGRARQKWVVNDPEEVRRDPARRSLSPADLRTPAEWGVPLSPRSPLTVMESFDQFQGQPELEPEPEPEPEPTLDREVALATAMALQAAEAAASGVKGIPPGLKKKKLTLAEGVPPESRGILRVVSGDGSSKPAKAGVKKAGKGLRGISKKLSQGRTLHVEWVEDETGSCETATAEMQLSGSEIRSRKRHVMWIGEQRMKEHEEPASPKLDGLMDGSVDRTEKRALRGGRDMSDIC